MKQKSSPRLKEFDYKGSRAYFLTLRTYRGIPHFIDSEKVNLVLSYLVATARKNGYKIYSYCFMPDHLHILVEGEENSILKDFMRSFKQKSEYYFRRKFQKRLWHLSYYDHILRKEETLKDITLYILNNPVRKGFVEDFRKYPYLGSLVFDISIL